MIVDIGGGLLPFHSGVLKGYRLALSFLASTLKDWIATLSELITLVVGGRDKELSVRGRQ